MRNQLLPIAALVLMTACGDIFGIHETGRLDVAATDDDVVLTNPADHDLYYFAVEAVTATMINWAPCVDPACPYVPVRASRAVPLDSIFGWDDDATDVLVFWWAARTENGRRVPAQVRGASVKVR